MNVHDPNLERVELVATALGPLRDELVFVGGCAAGLLPDFSNYLPGLISDDSSLTLTDEVLARLQVIAQAQG
jgi:hypothetical protein